MKTKRANRCVGFFSYCRGKRGFAPILITAAISLIALLAVAGWQIESAVHDKNATTSYVATAQVQTQNESGTEPSAAILPSGTSSTEVGGTALGGAVLDGLVAKYLSLQDQGLYTPEVGQKVAEKMATTLKAPVEYHTYAASDITTVADTSYQRMLAYRSDLQTSLAPLLKSTQPEFEIFAYYVETKDRTYLTKLQTVAQNYRAAVSATALVNPPKDALTQHLGILNAMEEFAATLEGLAANADDPFAAVAMLRTYNQAEQDMLLSFKALADYYRHKKP